MRLRRSPRLALTLGLFLVPSGLALSATFSPAYFLPASSVAVAPIATTPNDFIQPGTQPGQINAAILPSSVCANCHGNYDESVEPYTRWQTSMMAQATRDPLFQACLAIAEQDVAFVGEICIRCHSPGGWLEGRSTPTDGSALFGKDYDGVTCHVCHRMVDPIMDIFNNPAPDPGILGALTTQVPTAPHNAQLVVDPEDRRRGPFQLVPGFAHHPFEISPFHQEALLCASCHDVSNPAYERVGGAVPAPTDTYVLSQLDTEHPSHDKYEEFPIERTFSEWLNSDFANGGVDMGGLFGGNKQIVSSCQDCHMPDVSGQACMPGLQGLPRDDLPRHDFNGANTWVLKAVEALDQSLALYGPLEVSGLSSLPPGSVDAAIQRNLTMLEKASDMELSIVNDELMVRIINNGGHKLPSGYPEGRRMWLNVQYFDGQGQLVLEHGHYDLTTADLTHDTKIYEVELGMDAAVAAASGNQPGPGFHFALNNKYYKDNRIPPRGFTNANFEAIQAAPVDYSYADGQYWDDTAYAIPCNAQSVEVALYYQTSSKEYITFLRDANVTDNRGQIAYDQWVMHGKSAPALMDQMSLDLGTRLGSDIDSISLASGGSANFCLEASSAHAGKLYWLLGTISGASPGLLIDGQDLPLNFDAYTLFTILNPGTPPLLNGLGTLDLAGQGSASFVMPAGISGPNLVGTTLHHAYVVLTSKVVAASNAVALTITP